MRISKEKMLAMYTNMVRVRKLDEMIIAGAAEGFWAYHSQIGQEAVGVGVTALLKDSDYIYYTHRGHGIGKILPKGVSSRSIIAEFYGKTTGSCAGVCTGHIAETDLGIFGLSGTVGGDLTLAAGSGLAAKMRGDKQVVACFFGDGATGRGTLHTSMLMAANWKLPVVWVCENNLYGGFTPLCTVYPKKNLADLAFGYGIPGVIVDGQDIEAVYDAAAKAVRRARAGDGPTFLECKTYRFRRHIERGDDLTVYGLRDEKEKEPWLKRDPIELYKKVLLKKGVLSKAAVEKIEREAIAEMEDAEKFALASPRPGIKELENLVYCDSRKGVK